MKTKHGRGLVCVLALMALPAMAGAGGDFSPRSRTFLFSYQVSLKEIPGGARRVRVWIPLATTDANQTVVLKKVEGAVHLRETHEARFGNQILYGDLRHPRPRPMEFNLVYEVTRKELSRGDYKTLGTASHGAATEPTNLARFLGPDQLVPIGGKIKEMADEKTRGAEGTVEKAHALYDYVFQTVRYDKSGVGWGRGDSLWVCDSRHGNCSDFHSLFISLARAEGIPARFEIGFPVPVGAEGPVSNYHCWAEFFVGGVGWVPVDISEAWKDPRKHDYFFGSLDANRVQFTMGRDLTLQPKQDGAPLNYFIYPYVEIDGKQFNGIESKFSYREATRPAAGAGTGR